MMFEVLPPKSAVAAPPPRSNSGSTKFPSNNSGGTASGGGEAAFRIGSLVKCILPRRGVMLDRAEQQCLDLEVDYICEKGLVGNVVRVAVHSIVVDFMLSAADYKTIYPGPVLGNKDATTTAATSSSSSQTPSSNNISNKTNVADLEELISARKTLPINYVVAVVTLLDAERQVEIKTCFGNKEFARALKLSQDWTEEILKVEELELTDVAFPYELMAGQEKEDQTAEQGNDHQEQQQNNNNTDDDSQSSTPVWVQKMPSSVMNLGSNTVGSSLASHLRSQRRIAARHLLAWLYICRGMCKLQMGLGVTESAAVLSCGHRAILLDPTNARAYSVLISTYHCTSQLDQSLKIIRQCEEQCPQLNREDCEWLRSLILLDSVYRLYNPKLRPQLNKRIRIPLEVTIPNIQDNPSHLGLTALQEFQPGEVIMSETPCVWVPLSAAAIAASITPTGGGGMGRTPSSRQRKGSNMTPLNAQDSCSATSGELGSLMSVITTPANGIAGGGAAAGASVGVTAPSILTLSGSTMNASGSNNVGGAKKEMGASGSSVSRQVSIQVPGPVPQCAMCGFVLVEKSTIVSQLNDHNLADLSQRFVNRYPQRSVVRCRSGEECAKIYCSDMCEEQGWATFHRVDCSEGGLLTKQHLQTLRLATSTCSSTLADSALQLFTKVTLMTLCHTENKMKEAGVEYNSPDAHAFVTQEVAHFLGNLPVVLKLHSHGEGSSNNILPAVETTLHVLSVVGSYQSVISQAYEPFAYAVYQHCLLSHKIVSRCPVSSVLKAKPRQGTWPDVAQHFEAKMLCLFPIMGCALAPEQRKNVRNKSNATDNDGGGVGESLFSITSSVYDDSFDDLNSDATGEPADRGEADEDPLSFDEWPNVVIESTPGDLGTGFFTMRCPDDRGMPVKSDIITPLHS